MELRHPSVKSSLWFLLEAKVSYSQPQAGAQHKPNMMLKKQMHHDVIIANRGKADSTFQVCCCIPIQGRHQGEKSLSFLNLQLSLPSSFKLFAENLYRISAVAPARHCHEVSLVRVCCEGCRQW